MSNYVQPQKTKDRTRDSEFAQKRMRPPHGTDLASHDNDDDFDHSFSQIPVHKAQTCRNGQSARALPLPG